MAEAKDGAKATIDQLPNLTGDEKDGFNNQVKEKTTKEDVEQVVNDAKGQDKKNKEAKDAKELQEAKDGAKATIDQLPNLTGDEKDGFNNQVKEKTTKEDVEQVVNDAKGQDKKNKEAKDAKELQEAKDGAKATIDQLPNLTGDEKDGFNNQVKEKTTKGDVEQVVKDAQAKDAENKTAKEAEELKEAKAKAKEEIDKLSNLSKVEKDGYNNQVKEKTTKEDVAQVVKDAQAKDAANKVQPNKVQPGQDQPAQVQSGQGNSNNATTSTAFSSGRSYISLTKSKAKTEEKKTVTLEAVMTIGSRKLTRIIDGKAQEITMDVAAYIEQDRTYIPMRYVGESLGFDVSWDAANRMAILKNKNKEVKISVDSNIFYVNGEKFESDVKPQIKNDRTMIPVGNFARAIGLKDGEGILWGASKREVRIKQEIEL